MGKLRTEPKNKPFLSEEDYKKVLASLRQAREAAKHHYVYWEMDSEESPREERKKFVYVAKQEEIPVSIRLMKKKNCLVFKFEDQTRRGKGPSPEAGRMLILDALRKANKPLAKKEILEITRIPASIWNLRIKELVESGELERRGQRKGATYALKT